MLRAVLILAAVTAAAPEAPLPPGKVSIGQLSYEGLACPAGSVMAKLDEHRGAVGLLFTKPLGDTRLVAAPECRFELPITVPDGNTVAIDSYTYSGTATLPDGATADLTIEYTLAGRNGLPYRVHLDGPADSQPFGYAPMLASAVAAQSLCGLPARLIGTVRLQLRSTGGEAALSIAPGPLDFSGLAFHLSVEPC